MHTGTFRPCSRCPAAHQQELGSGSRSRDTSPWSQQLAALLPPATTPPEQQRLDTTHTSTSVKHGTDDRTSWSGPAQVRVGGCAGCSWVEGAKGRKGHDPLLYSHVSFLIFPCHQDTSPLFCVDCPSTRHVFIHPLTPPSVLPLPPLHSPTKHTEPPLSWPSPLLPASSSSPTTMTSDKALVSL